MEVDYLQLAIEKAWEYQFLTYPNPAVGAVLIVNNRVFVSAHKKVGEPHAEVNVIWEAFSFFHNTPQLEKSEEIHNYLYKHHNNFFKNATIYVTLEPCNHFGKTPPCSLLLSKLQISKVVIGIKDPIKEHSGGVDRLRESGIEVELLNDKRCLDLIEPFVKWQKDRFIFFKFAFSLNGVYKGGYITKKESLEWVHKVRDRLDLIVIGGETVRSDRPTLDCRFIGSENNPDVLIYSKQKQFDNSIPLFTIPNRKVFITDDLSILSNYNFIMIEGGEKLYQEVKEIVDWKLFIVNVDRVIDRDNFQFDENLENIYLMQRKDLFIFSK